MNVTQQPDGSCDDARPSASGYSFRAVGDVGLLIELHDRVTRGRVAAWLDGHELRNRMREVIPGAATVFIDAPLDVLAAVKADLAEAELPAANVRSSSRVITVDVRYDGPDLDEVASALRVSRREVIDLHTGATYAVEFFGFAPGLAFLGELPPSLRVPRRSSPRLRVPAGAVAIANEFSIVYPSDSPGGWSVIGTRLSEPLWDVDKTPPNAVAIGDLVRFRARP